MIAIQTGTLSLSHFRLDLEIPEIENDRRNLPVTVRHFWCGLTNELQ